MKILKTEVIDNTVQDENGLVQPSDISVLVEFEYATKVYELDFQTTSTHDYGAYSSRLAAYDGTGDYERLDTDAGNLIDPVLDLVLEKSKAQEIWQNYINKNYDVNEDHFGGIDGRSKINEAARK